MLERIMASKITRILEYSALRKKRNLKSCVKTTQLKTGQTVSHTELYSGYII